MEITLYQVDAFTDKVFGGNPAAVCPLDEFLDVGLMQQIAAENNLSETAFFVKNKDRFDLRWFTPEFEIDLCGHATLASAFVVLDLMGHTDDRIHFDTKSGPLTVTRDNGLLRMDFPARPPKEYEAPAKLLKGMGNPAPKEILASRDAFLVYEDVDQVRELAPEFPMLVDLDVMGVIATAPGEPGSGVDFVSRFFAPSAGIDEDPVTGSAHCTLIPYWSERLGKNHLTAHQVSARGGVLDCTFEGDRATMAGQAVLYMKGIITL
ncbi:MAG: PhzF family phenazine biosynthesis protein [Desulfovibrio sp.]|nr:MAG: PhzF family phenazine biosynthesis protein [Desulfovibrio sp.]